MGERPTEAELERALDIGVTAGEDGRIPLYGEHYDETKAAWTKAYAPLSCVAQASPELPTAFILSYAAKVAMEMERILEHDGSDWREWGIPLAAEAMFNLVTKHKDPLPKYVAEVERGEVFIPALLAPLLGKSNSEVRRMCKDSAIKVNRKPIRETVGAADLIGQVIVVGKQGIAVAIVEAT